MTTDSQKIRHTEDEYFFRRDQELIREYRARLDALREKAAHRHGSMMCPACGGSLTAREYHHVRVDVCPRCEGMWLDKGELEMLGFVPRAELDRFYSGLFGVEHR